MILLGDWEEQLADVTCDAVITDPPFDATTHAGAAYEGRTDGYESSGVHYDHWTPRDVRRFVDSWTQRCRGWIVALTSSGLTLSWQAAYRRRGWYSFAPVPCVIRGMTCRLSGDGPASWAVYAMVARPRSEKFSGGWSNPGAYVVPKVVNGDGQGRGKPPYLMSGLVRDYSRPDDLIVDPMCGYGSTGVAALSLGRRFIGCERDPAIHAEAVRALARPQQQDLFAAG